MPAPQSLSAEPSWPGSAWVRPCSVLSVICRWPTVGRQTVASSPAIPLRRRWSGLHLVRLAGRGGDSGALWEPSARPLDSGGLAWWAGSPSCSPGCPLLPSPHVMFRELSENTNVRDLYSSCCFGAGIGDHRGPGLNCCCGGVEGAGLRQLRPVITKGRCDEIVAQIGRNVQENATTVHQRSCGDQRRR